MSYVPVQHETKQCDMVRNAMACNKKKPCIAVKNAIKCYVQIDKPNNTQQHNTMHYVMIPYLSLYYVTVNPHFIADQQSRFQSIAFLRTKLITPQ